MPFHAPIPEKQQAKKDKLASGMGQVAQAEKLMQIAFQLPSAVLIGWLLGLWAQHLTGQKWPMVVGILFGCASGLLLVVRTAIAAEKALGKEEQSAVQKKDTKKDA